ncbi:hypothetical protein BDF21DRAFT_433273 [Thamnidium elegans]|uniref:Postreplication repair E3 ubiquitin-protein ligase RAD18 n=1 Tax=Thamnidium elegans TaxID=101142 RepID=A0A8H7VVH2_9FUNG|nr:hypothetical protein INT48_004148 [Thamnidium elegans]KAI8049377.1 hypothetical protein BDF21DRAFT_433273 [Thamnidium elegans]
MSFTTDPDLDDPSDFDPKPLQVLDENFRCPICKEFFKTALILSTCSHSFCALCIRRSLNSEQNCPKCRATAYENDLIHNYDLDHVVNSWLEARSFLLNSVRSTCEGTSIEGSVCKTQECIIIDDNSDDFVPQKVTASSSTTTRRSARLLPTVLEIEKVSAASELTDTSVVECPICCRYMKYVVLNKHMDKCAIGENDTPPPSSPVHNNSSSSLPVIQKKKAIDLGRKPTRVLYAMQSDKVMRELLRDLGLPDHGDKALKVWRHKEYVTLYNANYDSDSPVSANVLIQRLANIEHSQMNSKLKRKPTDSKEHKEKYRSEFDLLIERVKKQKSEESNKGKEKER